MPKSPITPKLRNFLAEIGKKGGELSKRTITPEQQKKMQQARRKASRAAKRKA
jgi:hypothetical protein